MSWQDIQRELLAAAIGHSPLIDLVTHPGTEASKISANFDDLARWLDEHYVAREPLTMGRDDIVLLPMDPVTQDHARLEALLSENAETIASFAKDAEAAVRIVAMMIGMDGAR